MTTLAKSQNKNLLFVARCALTLLLFVVLWQAAGGAEIATKLSQTSPFWLGATVALLLMQTVLSAQRWRVTAAQLGQRFSSAYALREYFLSQLFNQALPGGVVGDAARVIRARNQGGLMIAGQAVFFERLAGQIAMFLTLSIAFLSTLWAAGGVEWPTTFKSSLLVVVGTCLLLLVGLLALSTLRIDQIEKAWQWLSPLRKALLSRAVLPKQLLLGVAILLCNLLAFGFAARAVGIELSFVELTAFVPFILFAMLIPLTVSGWGVREGAAALILPISGFSVSASVAASIVFGLALLIAVTPGVFLLMKR